MGSRVQNSGLGEGQAWLHSLCPERPAGERPGQALLSSAPSPSTSLATLMAWWRYFSCSAVS